VHKEGAGRSLGVWEETKVVVQEQTRKRVEKIILIVM
jgi:hypothetical protein